MYQAGARHRRRPETQTGPPYPCPGFTQICPGTFPQYVSSERMSARFESVGRRDRGRKAFQRGRFRWSDDALWVADGTTPLDQTIEWKETSARWISTETNKALNGITGKRNHRARAGRRWELVECLRKRWKALLENEAFVEVLPPAGSRGLDQLAHWNNRDVVHAKSHGV